MKRLGLVFLILVFLFSFSSCIKKQVETEETQDFVTQNEDVVTDPMEKLDSEDEQVGVYAMSDFFNKGGATKGVAAILEALGISYREDKDMLEGHYGTYEYNEEEEMWMLVDSTTPSDGYLYKWNFEDTVYNKMHTAEFLFAQIRFYEDAPEDSYPTHVYSSLTVDDKKIEELEFEFNYTGSNETTAMTRAYAKLTFIGHSSIEVELNGNWIIKKEYEDDDAIFDILQKARLRFSDLEKNRWEEYRVTINDADHIDFEYETSEGWLTSVNLEHQGEVDGPDIGRVMIKGEITKNGAHAADIDGVVWFDESDSENNGPIIDDGEHVSYINVIYPDGTVDNILMDILKKLNGGDEKVGRLFK